jgi:hypothetical protein
MSDLAANTPAGCTVAIFDPDEIIPVPPVPFATLKADKWAATKALRIAHVDGGYTVEGVGRFDTDTLSRINISGAVSGAMIAGSAFSVEWKLLDNSLVTLDAAQMISVGMAVLGHVAACHAHSNALGVAIEATTDTEALGAINIMDGWPA